MSVSMKCNTRCLVAILAGLTILAGCDRQAEEPGVTERTLSELQEKYDALVTGKLDDPVQWATDDLENIGDWEYKILDVPDDGTESLQASLDEFGNERWEVFWIENKSDNYRIMLKRPSRSYLSRIPLSQIGRFVIGGSESEE